MIIQLLAYISETFVPDGNAGFLSLDKTKVHQLLEQSATIKAIAIGNSHSAAINFEALEHDGYTLVRHGGDLFETQYYIENLTPKLPVMDTVLISISYFSFHQDNHFATDRDIRRIHMYTVVPNWWFISGDIRNYIIGRLHPIVPVMSVSRSDNWRGVFEAIKQGKTFELELADTGCKYKDVPALEESAKSTFAEDMRMTNEAIAGHANLSGDIYQTLVDTTKYLQERNIRLIFFTPPYHEKYNKLYEAKAPDMLKVMRQNMQRLQTEQNVEYYDLSTDETFTYDNHLFFDSDHLNRCGAQVFSTKFRQMIFETN